MPLNPPETWIFRCLSKLKTIAPKALLGGWVGFLLTADSADSTASSTVALFLLLISAMVLCSGLVYRKWSCASSMPSPRDNQLKSQ